jgi:hypothetical protein
VHGSVPDDLDVEPVPAAGLQAGERDRGLTAVAARSTRCQVNVPGSVTLIEISSVPTRKYFTPGSPVSRHDTVTDPEAGVRLNGTPPLMP